MSGRWAVARSVCTMDAHERNARTRALAVVVAQDREVLEQQVTDTLADCAQHRARCVKAMLVMMMMMTAFAPMGH